MAKHHVLILGASYGSLLGTKLLLAGHDVTLACLPEEAEVINREGTRVRLPVRGRDEAVEIDSRTLPGRLAAASPDHIDPAGFDLVALAMQEPQYRAPPVRALLASATEAGRPCMSIMNMPPASYLARIPGLDVEALAGCYTDIDVWRAMKPSLMTLASPDPQAFRPSPDQPNVLQVSLPTNFKVARFESDEHTAILRRLASDIEAIRHDTGDGSVELPVKLKLHESIFVPLAKWSMLLTGNYRCIEPNGEISIRDAVHANPDRSRAIYEWVGAVCRKLGATDTDLVPFEKYARAAEGLTKPSSAARALAAGATHIERVDCVVNRLARAHGMQLDEIDRIVEVVDARLAANRKATA